MNFKEFFQIIIGLLNHHSCVIVPGLGGFVANGREATCQMGTGSFVPPSRELIFNQLLTHNDGILAQEIMRRRAVSFEQAETLIREVVDQLLAELKRVGSVQVEEFGRLLSKKGKIELIAQANLLPQREAYGLREFYFPELKAEEVVVAPKEPSSKASVLRPLLVGTAAAITLLFAFQPLGNEQYSTQQASLMLSSLQSEVTEQSHTIAMLKDELGTYKDSPVGFYWVVADFASQEEAQAYIEAQQLESFTSLQLINVEQHYYVSLANAMDKNTLMEQRTALMLDSERFTQTYILSVARMSDAK